MSESRGLGAGLPVIIFFGLQLLMKGCCSCTANLITVSWLSEDDDVGGSGGGGDGDGLSLGCGDVDCDVRS